MGTRYQKLAVICVVVVVFFALSSQIGNTTNMEEPSVSEDHRDDDLVTNHLDLPQK